MSSTHPNEEFSEKPTFETIPVEKVTPIVQIISLPQADKAIESATLESNKFGAVAQPAVKTLNSSASSQKKVRSNPAGESTQKMAAWYAGENRVQRMFTFVFWGAMIICVPLMFIFPSSSIKLLLFALVMYCIIDFILKKEKQSKKLKATYAKGAKGEIEIGQILAQLGGDFAVWHDVAGKYGNFDHVVLSKSGQLFMIETKANGGRVRVVGEKILINNYEPDKNMIRQCTSNWMALRDTVQARTGKTVFVIPLLVFTNAFVERSKPVKSIRIINKKFLKQAIYENCRGKVDRTHLWDDLAALDRLFSQKNLTYKEFARRDFEAISSWSK
jgi:hypothetical protein